MSESDIHVIERPLRQGLVAERKLAMSSSNTVAPGVALAGLILPAWPIWRIRRWYISIPVSALLSCWLLVTMAAFTTELNPDYDSFGAGMMVLFSPGLGLGYAVLLFALRTGTKRRRLRVLGRRHAMTGLAAWTSLFTFSVVIPFIAPPRARKGDPLFLTDYVFYCGPIILLAATMSLLYLWQLLHPQRAPAVPDADVSNQLSEVEQRRSGTFKLAIASIVLGVFSFSFGPLTGLPGLFLGQRARSRFRCQEDSSGRRAAELGMVICLVAMVAWGLCLGYEYLAGRV